MCLSLFTTSSVAYKESGRIKTSLGVTYAVRHNHKAARTHFNEPPTYTLSGSCPDGGSAVIVRKPGVLSGASARARAEHRCPHRSSYLLRALPFSKWPVYLACSSAVSGGWGLRARSAVIKSLARLPRFSPAGNNVEGVSPFCFVLFCFLEKQIGPRGQSCTRRAGLSAPESILRCPGLRNSADVWTVPSVSGRPHTECLL